MVTSALLAFFGVVVAMVVGGGVEGRMDRENATEAVYLVLLSDRPPASAQPSLRPLTAGRRMERHAPAVKKYAASLASSHVTLMRRCQLAPRKKVYSYRYAMNGFAALLTPEEATSLSLLPSVASVSIQQTVKLSSLSTASFLDLPGGLWREVGGRTRAGEDVIIGVVDSGIWPEHPSFSDEGSGYSDIATARPGWSGGCDVTEDFPSSVCSRKLVGAKYFFQGLIAAGDEPDKIGDFRSPRDSSGHGTHTASVAAGNFGVQILNGNKTSFGIGPIGRLSGIAPKARLAIYKVFWQSSASGAEVAYTSDVIAAIDTAVADGVDIINYSAGPNYAPTFFDPVIIAALFATQAGVFFSASAGNRGPEPTTLQNFQPWITTVAATTDDTVWRNGLCDGGLPFFPGSILSPSSGPTPYPFIFAENASLSGVDPMDAEFCLPDTLDQAKVVGRLVVCTNGFDDLTMYYSLLEDEVKGKGGVGLIIRNRDPAIQKQLFMSTPTQFPAVQISYADGKKLENIFNKKGLSKSKARIIGAFAERANRAPAVVDFSSRGPVDNVTSPILSANSNDILKPDIAAPGFVYWGAFSPFTGRDFDVESGTSVSAPVISGFAALLKQLHPDWSPYAMKSAIQTTATVYDNYGFPIGYKDQYSLSAVKSTPLQGPFDFGSGSVNSKFVDDPGLVYDSTFWDYIAFLYTIAPVRAGRALNGVPNPQITTRGRDLNLANFGISNLVGSTTVQRTVTSVAKGKTRIWRVKISAPDGVSVVVTPRTLFLAHGDSATYNVTFTVTDATNAPDFVFGSLQWRSRKYRVRSQIAVQALGTATPPPPSPPISPPNSPPDSPSISPPVSPPNSPPISPPNSPPNPPPVFPPISPPNSPPISPPVSPPTTLETAPSPNR